MSEQTVAKQNHNGEIVLSCQGLAMTYAEGTLRTHVFHGLDMAVGKGETVAILGASGAGKSTLLHLLGGLDTPTAGEVFVSGQKMSALSDAARGALRNRSLGFVYQFHHLLPEFTAVENVAMPLLIRRVDRDAALAKAASALKEVGLSARLEHQPGELSGGERQRCAFARALVTEPACVLADEPTGNLDPTTSLDIVRLLDRINRTGTTIVMATHDDDIVDQLRKRVVELDQGKLIRDENKGVYGSAAR